MAIHYYSKSEDYQNIVSINNYQHIFKIFNNKTPSLEDSLKEMFISCGATQSKAQELYKEIDTQIEDIIQYKYDTIKKEYPILDSEEIKTLCSYNCTLIESFYNPYKLINENLCHENKRKGLQKISKYFYIFLKALRKLTRYYPKNKYMYRCVTHKIKLGQNDAKYFSYQKNKSKFFWGFSSISTRRRTNKIVDLKNIRKEISFGTIFDLCGDIWGYDISLFKDSSEELIIMEPEQQFLIMNIAKPANRNGTTGLRCKYLGSNKVLDDLIKPDGIIIKYRINHKEIAIFGKEFVENNKDKCKIFVSGDKRQYNLSENFSVDINKSELEIHLKGLPNITDMSYMFSDCRNLLSIKELSKINTSSIINMKYLFYNCVQLNDLPPILNWNTSKVTDMSYLFFCCKSLPSLPNITHWDTSSVINMSYMFSNCTIIKNLPDISNWNTFRVNNIKCLFYNCFALEELPDISKWDISFVRNMGSLFFNCNSLKKLPDLSKWKIRNVFEISHMFYNCYELKYIPDISNWDTSLVTSFSYIFYNCENLSLIPDISKWNILNAREIHHLFFGCKKLIKVPNISRWNIYNVNNISDIFNGCESLIEIPDISGWKTDHVDDMSNLCYKCKSLVYSPDLSHWSIKYFCNTSHMFTECINCIKIPERFKDII